VGALLRTIVFTIFVPGIVAVLIPRWILPAGARWHADATGIVALILAAAGASIYFWYAFWAFANYGQGVGTVVASEAIGLRSRNLLPYLLIWGAFVYLFVLFYEEPTLRKKVGADYQEYSRRVPRWLPKLSAQD
jgi:hypothetical protein